MRKPRDFDAEMKALNDRAKQLKDRKVHQLGELIIATGADALSIEQLAGLLLAGMKNKDSGAKESWRKRGEDFFQGRTNNTADDTRRDTGGSAQNDGGTTPSGSQSRTS
jgi:DNA-binding protein H-NS